MGYNLISNKIEEFLSKRDLALNFDLSLLLGRRVKVMKEGENFQPYHSDDPVHFLDVIDQKTEPMGSQIARFMADQLRPDEKRNPVFHNLSKETTDLIMAMYWQEKDATIWPIKPSMTVITPVGDITSVGIFRDNPDFGARYSFSARGVSGFTYEEIAGYVETDYKRTIAERGIGGLVDWQSTTIFPHTPAHVLKLCARHTKIGDLGWKNGADLRDYGKKILSTFQDLNYYYQSTLYDAKTNHDALHKRRDDGCSWGMNEKASEIVTIAVNTFSSDALTYIISRLTETRGRSSA